MAARAGSDKVNEILNASKPPNIFMVNRNWLGESIFRWKRQDESAFPLSSKDGNPLPVTFGCPTVTDGKYLHFECSHTGEDVGADVGLESEDEELSEDSQEFEARMNMIVPSNFAHHVDSSDDSFVRVLFCFRPYSPQLNDIEAQLLEDSSE